VIEEIKAEDENTKVDTKRTVSRRKKQSFGDLSLELAKLHVSYIFQSFVLLSTDFYSNTNNFLKSNINR
jgi:hypothetical protein